MTQEDKLLINPKFANPNDPAYKNLTSLDFPDLLRKAMALEISSQRGDWEPISPADTIQYAANLDSPSGFTAAKEESPSYTSWEVPGTEKGVRYTVLQTVQGDKTAWSCTCPAFEFKTGGGADGCKHILRVQQESLEPPKEQPPIPTGPAVAISPEQWASVATHSKVPPMPNTRFPSEGVMVDGSPPPVPQQSDPWAVAVPTGPTTPVGGKVVLGGKKK